MKPRVCYILPEYDSAVGSHFFHLYELLGRARAHLDIFLVIEKAAFLPEEFPFQTYCQRFSFPPLRFFELLFVLLHERMRGRRYFYTHYSFFGGVASWLVTRVAGGTAYYWNCGMPWLYKRSRLEEAIFTFVLRHTILVTGASGLAEEYRRRYLLDAERVRILPNWVNIRRFQSGESREEARRHLGIPGGASVVLFVHRLSRRKGSHLIAPVAAEVTKKAGNAIFIIVGSGPERENLEFRIRNLKLSPRVRFVGEVPNSKIPDYFAAADIFFMPSEEEGFPHVLLEAQARGVPYVASDIGAVREMTPAALREYIVPSDDIGAFAAKIAELLARPVSERGHISAEEKKWVKRYDINEILPKFTALFS